MSFHGGEKCCYLVSENEASDVRAPMQQRVPVPDGHDTPSRNLDKSREQIFEGFFGRKRRYLSLKNNCRRERSPV